MGATPSLAGWRGSQFRWLPTSFKGCCTYFVNPRWLTQTSSGARRQMIRAMLRLIVTLVLCLIAVPLTIGAQSAAKIPRIGILQVGTAAATQPLFEAFKQGMQELGYVEGQHFVVERRLGEGRPERISEMA